MMPGQRFVVFDQETTGLNPESDRIVSIGAVAVKDGEIVLEDIFEEVLRVSIATPAVLVHGILPEDSRQGRDMTEAVPDFLDYIGTDVLVGHHVGFDRAILRVAATRVGRSVPNAALDTMRIALALEEVGVLKLEGGFELDMLCQHFGIVPHDRHTAPGDAFLTAQVFVRLQRLCDRHGFDVMSLCEKD
jgi:DNA polymerase-3 subunit epsilon